MKKKSVLLAALSLMMVAAIATATTLAYFTDTKTATNTFTTGNVKITLTEPAWDAAKEADPDHAKLIPSRVIDKDPTVTVVKDSEESYVRLLMTINKSSEWDAMFDGQADLTSIFQNYDSAKWIYEGNTVDSEKNTRTYEFRYYQTVASSAEDQKLEPLFTAIKVPGQLTQTQLDTVKEFEIVVVAQAIQAEGFDNNADAAWAAFAAEA